MKKHNLENLKIFLEKTSQLVEPKIKEVLNIYVDKKTQKLLNYQIETGGKRLRPALTIAACLVCGGKMDDALYPAAGLEILHNYTLIIDDIIDNSIIRRSQPTTWAKFGKSIAECIAVCYSATIFQTANQSKNPTVISELFTKTMKIVAEGEILDILFEQSGRDDEKYIISNRYKKITEQDYLKMISKKTSALVEACCEIGGICSGAKKEQITALKNYGFNSGIAFQIQDDILDIFGEEKIFGKKIGKDIEERKLGNIVVLLALKELSSTEKKNTLNIFRKKEITNKDIQEVIKVINKTKAKEKAYLLGEKYTQKARESLKLLPQNKWNDILSDIINFALERKK